MEAIKHTAGIVPHIVVLVYKYTASKLVTEVFVVMESNITADPAW